MVTPTLNTTIPMNAILADTIPMEAIIEPIINPIFDLTIIGILEDNLNNFNSKSNIEYSIDIRSKIMSAYSLYRTLAHKSIIKKTNREVIILYQKYLELIKELYEPLFSTYERARIKELIRGHVIPYINLSF